jgi:hypothetical protein
VTGPCASITSFTPTAGYRPLGGNMGAVWLSYTLLDCSSTDTTQYRVDVVETPVTTLTGWTWAISLYANLLPGTTQKIASVDNDWALINTQYTVTMTVSDWTTGAVLASASKVVTTPKGKGGVTAG